MGNLPCWFGRVDSASGRMEWAFIAMITDTQLPHCRKIAIFLKDAVGIRN